MKLLFAWVNNLLLVFKHTTNGQLSWWQYIIGDHFTDPDGMESKSTLMGFEPKT